MKRRASYIFPTNFINVRWRENIGLLFENVGLKIYIWAVFYFGFFFFNWKWSSPSCTNVGQWPRGLEGWHSTKTQMGRRLNSSEEERGQERDESRERRFMLCTLPCCIDDVILLGRRNHKHKPLKRELQKKKSST